jgi:hypothetical protein
VQGKILKEGIKLKKFPKEAKPNHAMLIEGISGYFCAVYIFLYAQYQHILFYVDNMRMKIKKKRPLSICF